MPSPFPGMDPYLEHPDLWPGVHHWLIIEIARLLSPQLRPKYRVAVEVRMYETTGENSLLVGIPDVTVKHRLSATNSAMTNVAVAAPTAQPARVTIPVPQQITTNTASLPLLHEFLKELKLIGVRFPEDRDLNDKVTLLEQELAKFEEDLKHSQDAASWLAKKNTRLHLAKDAGDEALRICSLKLPDTERGNFYKDIYKYLTWIFFTLYYGSPMPVELISPSLQNKKAYQEAFKYILKMMPKDLSVDADKRVKSLIKTLMKN